MSRASDAPSIWRNRGFLALWFGQAISETGSQVSFLAVPLTAIIVLHADAFQAGLLGTFQFAPFLLVGLPAGVWVDRWRRRFVLIVADCGRLLALGSIPVAAQAGVLTLLQLYVVAVISGVLTVFFDVAYQSFLPALVSPDQLIDGNAKLSFTQSTAELVGPGLGGALVGAVGAARAVTVDAASYLVSVISLLFVRGAREEVPDRATRRSLRIELGEGLRYVLGNPVLRSIAGCTGTVNFFIHLGMAVVILYATNELHLTPAAIGLWFGLGGIGAPIGAVVAGRLARRFGTGPTITGIVWATGWSWFLVVLAPRASPLPWLIAAGVVGSFGGVVYNVTQVSLRQAITPHRLQGRMNASMRFLVWGTIPLGSFAGGVIGQAAGLRTALWISAAGALLASLWVSFGPVPRLRSAADAQRPEGNVYGVGLGGGPPTLI
ncbi:MAG: MFS transporter [Candidatus Dormibacteria bacterium]